MQDNNTRPRLSLVCFAYNEAATLERAVDEFEDTLTRERISREIIIIDDGSSDGTSQIADQLAKKYQSVLVIHHPRNLGLGYGFREGFEQFQGQLLTFFSTDRQFPASILTQFVPLMSDYDLILGYIPEQKRSLVGYVLSRGERLLLRCLLGPLPRFQGAFMVRREVIDGMALKSSGRGWMIQMELIIRATRKGYRIKSVLTEYFPREAGWSKANTMKNVFVNLLQLFKLYMVMRRENLRK